MRLIETTVVCDYDGCTNTITVTGHSHADITAVLTYAGWPRTRGRRDHCPAHRQKDTRR